jgi:hypothetical protein
MVLAHHLYDVVTTHRASRNPLISSQDDEFETVTQLTKQSTVSVEQNPSVDVETLRSMFEARDIALNKLISSTTALAQQTSETMDHDSPTSPSSSPMAPEQLKESETDAELEFLKCLSCQEIIQCSFPPLRSAVAVHQRNQLSANPLPSLTTLSPSDLEPRCTNWTTDFVG